MGIAGLAVVGARRALLIGAFTIAGSGLVALGLLSGPTGGQRVVGPASDDVFGDISTLLQPNPGVDPTTRVRSKSTSTTRGHARSANGTTTTSPPTTQPPTSNPRPNAQFDVAVPAAGAHVAAGQGEGSCTTAGLTALTPEGCPAPPGDGPVVVHYQGPGSEPKALSV
jgi:hypothetical protein